MKSTAMAVLQAASTDITRPKPSNGKENLCRCKVVRTALDCSRSDRA